MSVAAASWTSTAKGQAEPPPSAPAPVDTPIVTPSKRVHVFIDRRHEFGGDLISEDTHRIVVKRDGEEREFLKGQVLSIVPLLAAPDGKIGHIHLRDGSTIHAQIIEDGLDGVVYEAAGIRLTVPREKVFRTTLEVVFEVRYDALRAGLKPTDFPGRLALCQWLFDEQRYELAQSELRALLAQEDVPEAASLLRQCQAQLALGTTDAAKARGARSNSGATDDGPPSNRNTLPDRILTQEEVNVIRVYELDFAKPPPVFIERETITELIEKYGSSSLIPPDMEGRNRIYSADAREVARLMFDLKAREFYPRIRVGGEPQSLATFWHKVHDAWLIPNCTTSKCHGGVDAGGFFLHQRNYKDDQVRYTNLLILLKSRFADGPLIDFDDPRSSLLVQYALTPGEARHPHPPVRGWKAVFVPTSRRLLEETERWIRSMYVPRPEYPVDYTPPLLDAVDQPSSAANTKPSR
ncbi:MAG: hypothetical protein EXS00_09155 [Phycisphaerales bacterium]|nr:hypothetical protein [Phycisphaerales bacterium]